MKKIVLILSLFAFLFPTALCSMMGGMEDPAADPLRGMSYRAAFDAKRFKKFPALMRREGCAENVGIEHERPQAGQGVQGGNIQNPPGERTPLNQQNPENLKKAHKKEEERFINASLSQLRHQRRLAIMMKSIDASVQIGMMGLGTVGVYIGDHHSFATELVISSAAVISIYNLKTIIGGVRNLIWTPSNEELDELEIEFSTNQCFIPRELWSFIINKFSMARQNPFSQQEAMDAIRFALGLTTFRRTIPISDAESGRYCKEISEKIDPFFEKYQDPDPFAIHSLKLGIFKFIEALKGNTEIVVPYIFLHGEPGIGKTKFVKDLIEWMKAFFKNNVHFYEDAIITSPEELEGGPNKPGFLLRVLQRQCLDKKSASFVFFDEASWLNEQSYLSPSKRVFNGKATKLSSTYFGNGTEGKGLDLTNPLTFLIFSANDSMEDEALNSRFTHIQFPNPKPEALEEHCKKVYEQHYKVNRSKQEDWVLSEQGRLEKEKSERESLEKDWTLFREKFIGEIKEFKNFRRIEKELPSLMQPYVEEKEDPSKEEADLLAKKPSVDEKVEAFFNDYQDPDFAIDSLKSGISNFIQALKTRDQKAITGVRYIYLHGKSGIGKTYFVEELKKWMQELEHFKRMIHFEDAIITSPQQIEGGPDKPGFFIRMLQNQRSNKKSASFVFFDDASWLNEQTYLNSSKRVFNGKSLNLSSSYLGNGTEEKGQDVAIPPMFLIFCAKAPIEDETLSGCFEHVQFPNPSTKVLLDYSEQVFCEQCLKTHFSVDRDWVNFKNEFGDEIKELKNFRRVRKELPSLMQAYAEEKEDPSREEHALLGSMKVKKSSVDERVDAFFNGYQDPDPFAVDSLKSGIFKFIQALKTRDRKAIENVPFIYLHGKSGIGKTYFVEELKKWMQELEHFKRMIHFEDAIIKSPEDLEGGEKKPGLLVRVLQNQRSNKKSASFVFFDDASWLNEQPYLNSSKRVFNGKSLNLSSSYLGNGTEEKGQDIAISPMFLIFCAKAPIEDETLSGCFEHAQFPNPKPELSLDYSKQIFSEQGHKAHLSADTDWNPFQEEFSEEIKKFKNPRRVRKELPLLMKTYARKTGRLKTISDDAE